MSTSVSASRPVGRPRGSSLAFKAGSKNSVARLDALNFDPIGALVESYQRYEYEIERQEDIRDGIIVELTQAGKPRAYRAEVHHNLIEKQSLVAEKLLRYRYGRVPENVAEKTKGVRSLIIELTGEGETYVVNGGDDAPDDDMPDMPMKDVTEHGDE